MEIEELKAIWQQYDSRLDHLEKLNKKLILETLTKKPQKKLNWMKYRSLYTLIILPTVPIIALHDYWKIENIDLKFVIGCFFTLSVCIYLCYVEFKSYMALKGVDLSNDSIIESARKVSVFKSIVINRQKSILMTSPILLAGILLICWKGFHFDSYTIMFMLCLCLFSLTKSIILFKRYKEKIDKLHKEILDLNESIE